MVPEDERGERRTRRAFVVLVAAASSLGPAYALLVGSAEGLWPSLALSLATAALGLLLGRAGSPWPRLLLAFALAAAIPVQYGATGAVIDALDVPTHDDALRALDASFLGWLFPDGQMSLWIDQDHVVGPDGPPGRVLTEFFQIAYFSYYVWGLGLFFLLAWRLGRGQGANAWRHLRMWLCAWVGAYLVNYVGYVIVPAWGPWIAYPEMYEHALEGLWLTVPIRTLIAENMVTPDCLPSGHTALSWIAALAALRLAPRYGRAALAAAILITLATVGLRYHYASDVVAAIPLVLFGLWWGGFLTLPRPRRA